MELDGPQFKHRCDDLNRLGFVERLRYTYRVATRVVPLRNAIWGLGS